MEFFVLNNRFQFLWKYPLTGKNSIPILQPTKSNDLSINNSNRRHLDDYEPDDRGETYNAGGASEMENIAIVGMILDILDEIRPQDNGRPRWDFITHVKNCPGHDRRPTRYAIDFSKLRQELG